MDGEEHRPPTPHRSGRARAPQAPASALARAEVDGAVLVWCTPLTWFRPVLLTLLCVSGDTFWYLHPSAPDESSSWFWGFASSEWSKSRGLCPDLRSVLRRLPLGQRSIG